MSQHNSPFVVDQLRPEGLGGKSGGVYQLTASSVSPSRIVGRDEIGMPVEDTVPAAYHRALVDPHGNVTKVPMRTASVFSMEPEAERYEQQTTRDLISAGWIPLDVCPYSTEYTHLTRGPFVKPPAGEEDCGGKPGGCSHMQAVIRERLKRSRAIFDADQAKLTTMKTEDVERIQEVTAKAFGAAMREHFPDPRANRTNLRTGKGEE